MIRIKIVFFLLLRIATEIIPKKSKSIFLYQTMPHKDNISAIIDEMIKNDTINKYEIFFNWDVTPKGLDSRIQLVRTNTIKSLWHYLRSKYIICDNGIYGLIYSSKQIVVYTTHGMPNKKFGYLTKESFIEKKLCRFLPQRIASYVIATSPFFTDILSRGFSVPKECILITGLPRNDYLFDKDSAQLLFNEICGKKHKKKIIWMPTYRKSQKALSKNDGHDYELGIPLLTKENIYSFDEALSRLGVILVIKNHGLQDKVNTSDIKLNSIQIIDSDLLVDNNVPLNSFVNLFDALITDYSSIFYDFLILNKPICHIVDDYQEYEAKRGFPFEKMIDLFPGELAFTRQDVENFISDIANGIDRGYVKRNKMANVFNTYKDNNNTKRFLKAINLQ